MIYLNNAGTSWPKPPEVRRAVLETLDSDPASWSETYERALDQVTEFFGLPRRDRFLFTSGATAALATALTDLEWSEGDTILTSHMEHHALFRWLFKLADERGVRIAMCPYAPGRPLDLDFARETLRKGGVKLIAVSHAANATGEVLPIPELVELARDHDALVLLDAAQTAGVLPMNIAELDVDMFVFAGHKGALGPQGIGGLYVGERVRMKVPMAACEISPGASGSSGGGSGASPSAGVGVTERACANTPSFCDVGSFNVAGGAGLAAGIAYLRENNLEQIHARTSARTLRLMHELRALDRVEMFGARREQRRTHAFSFRIRGMSVADAGARLKEAGIMASAGLQCSPLAHEALGTADGGTLRMSAGPFTTDEEIAATIAAVEEIVRI